MSVKCIKGNCERVKPGLHNSLIDLIGVAQWEYAKTKFCNYQIVLIIEERDHDKNRTIYS